MNITGTIIDGLGEGAAYVKRYHAGLKASLGFDPYPGTLNIKVSSVPEFRFSREVPSPGKGLFAVSAVPACISDSIEGAIIRPKKTSHGSNIMEVIAPIHIKTALQVKAGDQLTVSI